MSTTDKNIGVAVRRRNALSCIVRLKSSSILGSSLARPATAATRSTQTNFTALTAFEAVR